MQTSKMAQSEYVLNKTQTPTKQKSYIELSPKGKSRRKLENQESSKLLKLHQSSQVNGKLNDTKQNHSSNFQIVNMPIRIEKPFQKIPKFNNEQIIVRSRTTHNLDSQNYSRRKKITVTKILNENPVVFEHSSPYISKLNQSEQVGDEQF